MKRTLILALVGLVILACGEGSPSPRRTTALSTVAASSAAVLPSDPAHLPEVPRSHLTGSEFLLQDTARTVTRRIWPEADLYDISPDGRLVVQTDWTTGDLAVRDMETGEVRHLTRNRGRFDPGEAEDARFSPDGKWVAYTWYDEAQPAFYKLGVVDIEGTNPRLVYRDQSTSWIQAEDWSPDGRYVLAQRSVTGEDPGELLLISAADGSARLLKRGGMGGGVGGGVRFSPDGRYVAYHAWRENPEDNDIFAIDVATGEEHPLVAGPANDEMLGWASDGGYILFRSDRSGTPGAWLLPVTEGRAGGEPWLVKPDMWRTNGLRFSQDGRYYFRVSTQRRDVYVIGFDSETKTVIGTPTTVSPHSRTNSLFGIWSPGGRYIAYVAEDASASAVQRVVVRSMDTGDEREFELGKPGQVGILGWTADGRSVVGRVFSPGDGVMTLYQIDVQTGRKDVLSDPRQSIPEIYPRTVLEHGPLVYLVDEENADGQAAFHILRYDAETGDSTVLFRTPYGAWGQILSPALSPDGQTLAFGYSPVVGSDPHSLILLPVSGDEPRELPIEGARRIAWMPDGKALLLLLRQRPVDVELVWEAWYLDLSGGEPQPIGLTVQGTRVALDIRPDGRSISYTSSRGGSELWVMENFLPRQAGRKDPSLRPQ
jgi:Tol biopolymer transport system component